MVQYSRKQGGNGEETEGRAAGISESDVHNCLPVGDV